MYEYIIDKSEFEKIHETDLEKVEQEFSFKFPDPLRQFYLEVGWGRIAYENPVFKEQAWQNTHIFLPPRSVLCFMNGQLFDGNAFYMDETTYEFLEPGEIPFYEEGDSTYFINFRTDPEHNGEIWTGGVKIAESFEKFVGRLYNEGPEFYLQYLEA